MSEPIRIGYLVPEFPGQTHIMFWRDIMALHDLGVECRLLSSRLPREELMSNSWSAEAVRRTTHLYPLELRDLAEVLLRILAAGPRAWVRCGRAVATARLPFREKLGLAAMIPFAAKTVGWAKRNGLHHIHVGSCGNVANIAMLARLLGGPAYSLSLLGPRLGTYGANQDQKWRHADFGLCQSRQLYDELAREVPGLAADRIEVAPVGVDVSVMKRDAAYVPWTPGTVCRIYCCARLNPVKGHLHLVEAVRHLRDAFGIDARLILGGEDIDGGSGYRKVLEAAIRDSGMEPHVELLGAVSEEVNRAQYASAHIHAMASLDEAAGAVAAMEAMAMEVPVVMTDVGATRELIDDQVDGLIVPASDHLALALAMHRILLDRSLAMRLGAAGRAKVRDHFNSSRHARSLRRLLSS